MGSERYKAEAYENPESDDLVYGAFVWRVVHAGTPIESEGEHIADGFAPDAGTARDCAELVAERLAGRDVRAELAALREACHTLLAAEVIYPIARRSAPVANLRVLLTPEAP